MELIPCINDRSNFLSKWEEWMREEEVVVADLLIPAPSPPPAENPSPPPEEPRAPEPNLVSGHKFFQLGALYF